jgi:hypothetical protein
MQSFPSRQHVLVLFDYVAVEEQFVVVDMHRVVTMAFQRRAAHPLSKNCW